VSDRTAMSLEDWKCSGPHARYTDEHNDARTCPTNTIHGLGLGALEGLFFELRRACSHRMAGEGLFFECNSFREELERNWRSLSCVYILNLRPLAFNAAFIGLSS
jgi:hypothetical protein